MRHKPFYTKNQLKTVQKTEHNLAYMDYAKIFCLQFYWLLVLQRRKSYTICGNDPPQEMPFTESLHLYMTF